MGRTHGCTHDQVTFLDVVGRQLFEIRRALAQAQLPGLGLVEREVEPSWSLTWSSPPLGLASCIGSRL